MEEWVTIWAVNGDAEAPVLELNQGRAYAEVIADALNIGIVIPVDDDYTGARFEVRDGPLPEDGPGG